VAEHATVALDDRRLVVELQSLGVRIEDDVHLSATGPKVLTNFSRELLEVA